MKKLGLHHEDPESTRDNDEYANRIPNPKHTPKYTKAKVLHTEDKHSSAEYLCTA